MNVYTIFDVNRRCKLYNVTPQCNWSILLEDRTCLMIEYMKELC